MLERKILIRRASFVAYFLVVFLSFLLLLFPFDRVKLKLESEVRLRTPLELSVARISPRFFNRFLLSDVVVSDKNGTVFFESPAVKTSISLFSLLRGGISVNLKAIAYGGELYLKMRQARGENHVMLDANGLDVASYTLFRNMGYKISGKIGGNFEMNGDSGKGRLWMKSLASRELKIQGFSIPDLDFEKGWVEADIKGDRLMLRKFELDGKELKIRATGSVVLRERGMINLKIKLKPSERLAHEQSAVLSLLKNRDAAGFYHFTLGGLVSQPMPRL